MASSPGDNLISFEDETDTFDVDVSSLKNCNLALKNERDVNKIKLRKNSLCRPPEMVTAVYDYEAKFSDELNLKRGSTIEVLSKDAKVSGDEGWWTGKLKTEDHGEKVGVFPSNFVQSDLNATLINLEARQDSKDSSNALSSALYVDFSEITFENLIGVGGFGKVYKATWRGQPVAVKAAHVEPGLNLEQVKECVEREARLFHLLSHPNIVSLVGVSLTPPNLCLLLEYCAGDALCKILRQNSQKLSADVLIDWAMQIARGMYYLHEQAPVPLVHRDLKSSNASDVWSYGVLLWELLTGETPYKNIDAMAIAYGVAVNQLTLPIPSTCPEHFTKMMSACWSIEPHKRPSFRQLLSSLEDFARTTDRIEDASFHSMQENWREEIQALFGEIKSLENEIRDKEEQLRNRAAKQEIKEEILRQREAELEHREIELVHRELQLLLLKPVEPPLRHGKTKIFGGKHATGEKISLPTGFRNIISVKHVLPHRTSSQSPPTSPQGSRSELRVPAYNARAAKLSSPESPPLHSPALQAKQSITQRPLYNFSTWKNDRISAKMGEDRCKDFHWSTPDLLQQNVAVPSTTPEDGLNVGGVVASSLNEKSTNLQNYPEFSATVLDFKPLTATETAFDERVLPSLSPTRRPSPSSKIASGDSAFLVDDIRQANSLSLNYEHVTPITSKLSDIGVWQRRRTPLRPSTLDVHSSTPDVRSQLSPLGGGCNGQDDITRWRPLTPAESGIGTSGSGDSAVTSTPRGQLSS